MNEDKKNDSVEKIFRRFKTNLLAINDYFKNFGIIANETDNDNIKKMKDLINSTFEENGIKEGKKRQITLSKLQVLNLIRGLEKTVRISTKNFEILSRSSFLMLNNYFEYLLSDLLAYHYDKFQSSLNEKNFNLALKEVNEYETLEEFTKSLISKEVEAMMVKFTFKELLDHFEKELLINNEKDIIDWELLIECRERRHLIVHNSSLVNKKYLSRTKNLFNFKIGDVVKVDEEYFIKTSNEFYLAGLLISLNCWGKWDKENSTRAISEVLDETFELLKMREYKTVAKITDYCKQIEPRDDKQEDSLLRITINRLIALKKLKDSNLNKELKKIKIGTASPIFKLAYAILSEDYKNIIDLVKKANAIDDLRIDNYMEWPVFEFVREIPDINTAIETELKKKTPKSTKRTLNKKDTN